MNLSSFRLMPVIAVILRCVVVCSVGLANSAARADDIDEYMQMDLEQLVNINIVTASKYRQKSSDTAATVTVIDKQQIKLFGYRNLADALRSVPGFFINDSRLYQNAGIRGFDQSADYNGRMLVMIDGIRMNETIYDSGFVGNELPLDVDLVERIEVIRGPGSSIYGSNAFFAVVNVITRNAKDFQGGEVAGAWSSFDSYKGRFSYGRRHDNGLEYLLSGSGFSSDGPTLAFPEQGGAANPRGLTRTNDEHGKQVFTKARWGDFSFEGGYGIRNIGAAGGVYGTNFDDRRTYYDDRQAFANLQYETALSSKLDFTARAFYGDYQFEGVYQYDETPNYSLAHAWWSGFETRLVSTHFDRHTLMGGIEVQENWLQSTANFDRNPYYLYSLDQRDSHRIGVYVQDDIAVTDQLKLSLGARMDDYSLVSRALFSPRIGLVYKPLADTTLRLQYGQAFRAANISQQFQAYDVAKDEDGNIMYPGLLANPSLQPEQVETLELGIEQQIAKYWRFSATGYYMDLDKLIAYQAVSDEYEQQLNVDNQRGYGGEFELRRHWDNGALLRGSYSVQYARHDNGDSILDAPRHLFQLNASAPLFSNQWHAGVDMQVLSGRQSLLGDVPAYTRLNLNLLYQPVKSIDISATVYDLLDDYALDAAPGGLPLMSQEGRGFRLKLAYRF